MTTPNDPKPGKNLGALVGAGVLLIAIGGALYARSRQPPAQTTPQEVASEPNASMPPGGSSATVVPAPDGEGSPAPEVRELPAQEYVAQAFWLDVLEPAPFHAALRGNAWANKTLQAPLGKGFVGGWAALFGTRGDDVASGFKGVVLELFTERFLSAPYRVVWFSGKDGSGVPAVVIDGPTGRSDAAWSALLKLGQKGGFKPSACPQAPEGVAQGQVPEMIYRFTVAEQVLFGVRLDERLVFARSPAAALQGSCLGKLALAKAGDHVAEVGVSLAQAGRGAQAAGALMGLSDALRFGLALQGGALVPTGLMGALSAKGRLGEGPLDDALLKAVPVDTAVVLSAQLKLPVALTAQEISAHLAPGGAPAAGQVRQVAVLWNPRADGPLELAILWNTPSDEAALKAALATGPRALTLEKECGLLVLASSVGMHGDVVSACKGERPSLLQAAPAIVKGLKAPQSLGVNLNLGKLGSQLLLDGWLSEHPLKDFKARPSGPPEIEEARAALEELPFFGWRGVVDAAGTLTGGGFRS